MKKMMLALSVVLVGVVFGEVQLPTDKAKFKLVVLAGQSNMAGRGKIDRENNKPHPRVVMMTEAGDWVPCVDPIHFDIHGSGVGPGKSFAEALADSDPTIVVGVVPTAVGGTPLERWVPGAIMKKGGRDWHPYDDMVGRTKKAQEKGTLTAILWHQGEANCSQVGAYAYQWRFPIFIERFRKDVGAEGVPLIVGGLRNGTKDAYRKTISDAERWTCEYAFGPGKFVPCEDDCPLERDNIHYTGKVQQAFGKRYFAGYEEVMKNLAANKGYWKKSDNPAAKIKPVQLDDLPAKDQKRRRVTVPPSLPPVIEKWFFPNGRHIRK